MMISSIPVFRVELYVPAMYHHFKGTLKFEDSLLLRPREIPGNGCGQESRWGCVGTEHRNQNPTEKAVLQAGFRWLPFHTGSQ